MGITRARLIRVTGLVQGVGFRPTVYRIAIALNLSGEVFNDAQGVGVVIEGSESSVQAFAPTLLEQKPPLARIDSIEEKDIEPKGLTGFSITPTQGGKVSTAITADAATCEACLEDMFNESDRRYRYAFTNCTHCGPRFTITRHLPYDRPQTSMAPFAMCPACLKEYEDPLDRRFHAQPNACPHCGPSLTLTLADKTPIEGDPIDEAVCALREGKIVAVKGLGGFHLVCDAKNPQAVKRLRDRKHRDEKPLAIMVLNVTSAKALVKITPKESELLTGVERPIVLCEKVPGDDLPGIAPALSEIGIMLPYTPLHWTLFHSFAGKPRGIEWTRNTALPTALVMTSANPGGEPLVIDNDEAYERLGHIADYFLLHNRDILVRCDDSVMRVIDEEAHFVRRARGYTPKAVKLPFDIASVLATGPYLKNTAALSRGAEIFLSQHIGDLENRSSCRALELAVQHLESVLEIAPEVVACDAHPDFFSSALAQEVSEKRQIPLVTIAHHAAHIGTAMAERGLMKRTIGLALDGVGLGPDGNIWGGEILACDNLGFERLGHLLPLALPGGDRAAKEPRRMAAAVLWALNRADEIALRWPDLPQAAQFSQLIANTRLTRRTSAMGRWFDAAASLLGLCDTQHDEAHAAMLLESLASTKKGRILPNSWRIDNNVLNLLPLMGQLADANCPEQGTGDIAQAAADFHVTLSSAICDWVDHVTRNDPQRHQIALTGGCFLNRQLSHGITKGLEALDIQALPLRDVPPGDGGIALGQAWLAGLVIKSGATQYVWRGDKIVA